MNDETKPAPSAWASYPVAKSVDSRRLEFNARTSRKATKVVNAKAAAGISVAIPGLGKRVRK